MRPSDSQEATNLRRKLTEMKALDDQPFSVVNNIGFRPLMNTAAARYVLSSDTYILETLLLMFSDAVKTHLTKKPGGGDSANRVTCAGKKSH
jgi:hypothetical protein